MGRGDRQPPPRDRAQARPCRGPQQPGHPPEEQRAARGGDRRLPPRPPVQARLLRGLQQPGQRPERPWAGSTRRSPPTRAPSGSGPTMPRPTTTWARPCRPRARRRGDRRLRRAIELKPDYAEAHNNLGIALGEPGAARRGDRRLPARPPVQSRTCRAPKQPGQRPRSEPPR